MQATVKRKWKAYFRGHRRGTDGLEQELKLLQEQCDRNREFDEEYPTFVSTATCGRNEHVTAVARINSILQLMNNRFTELEDNLQNLQEDTHG